MDNRGLILDCALKLFAARGYDAVGVQEIVDAAGISKPTLYHYFNSKRGLLDALLESHFLPLLDGLHAAAAYRGDLKLALEGAAQFYFDFAAQHPAFYRMQLALYFAPPDSEPNQAVAGYNLSQHLLLEALFQQAALDHGNMLGRQRRYAASFLGTINTYAAMQLNSYIVLDESVTRQLVHQFMHGILS